MKKFLSALIALTMAVSPAGHNVCSAAETATTETTQELDAAFASALDTDASQDSNREQVTDSTPVDALAATELATDKDTSFWKKALRWSGSMLGAPLNKVTTWWNAKNETEKQAFVTKAGGALCGAILVLKVLGCVLHLPRRRLRTLAEATKTVAKGPLMAEAIAAATKHDGSEPVELAADAISASITALMSVPPDAFVPAKVGFTMGRGMMALSKQIDILLRSKPTRVEDILEVLRDVRARELGSALEGQVSLDVKARIEWARYFIDNAITKITAAHN